MGTFAVYVKAVGGHGCQRDRKDGQEVTGCGEPTCPDCMAREFVKRLKGIGCNVEMAELVHWPDTPSEVWDNLLTGIRKGSF